MTLHIFTPNKISRIRRQCPYHKHFCYGSMAEYYDGFYVTFDCGARIDSEFWYPPPKKKCPNCRKWFRPLEMIEHKKEHLL